MNTSQDLAQFVLLHINYLTERSSDDDKELKMSLLLLLGGVRDVTSALSK